jgi:hypothetical protein
VPHTATRDAAGTARIRPAGDDREGGNTTMDTASIDAEYLVATFEEDDDPEQLIGDAVDYDLIAALAEEE